MSIETEISALTTATTTLTTAVALQQTEVSNAVSAFTSTTTRVNELNLVENTTDLDKVVSNLVQIELGKKQETLVSGLNISTINGESLLSGLALVIQRSATSLNKVSYDDRVTLRSLSPQLDDSTVIENLGLFMWIDTKLEPDDDETCFNTATGQWLLRAPAWDLIDAWSLFETEITNDWREDEPKRFALYMKNY
jgi:flagellin-like hook-associated protein FlgL